MQNGKNGLATRKGRRLELRIKKEKETQAKKSKRWGRNRRVKSGGLRRIWDFRIRERRKEHTQTHLPRWWGSCDILECIRTFPTWMLFWDCVLNFVSRLKNTFLFLLQLFVFMVVFFYDRLVMKSQFSHVNCVHGVCVILFHCCVLLCVNMWVWKTLSAFNL